ncbi:cupredoxin domain-containing protein, partial [archaeon]|nr:cupredoxin domain-containing protein [archaeon]
DEKKNIQKAALAAEQVKTPAKSGIGFPILIIGALAVFGIFVFVLFPMLTPEPQDPGVVSSVEQNPEPVLREITMVARQWAFEPGTITVNQGDEVKLTIESVDVAHGFALPDFGVNEQLIPGQTTNIEFVADKKGSYRFFCNVVCGQGHSSMSGLLIVN